MADVVEKGGEGEVRNRGLRWGFGEVQGGLCMMVYYLEEEGSWWCMVWWTTAEVAFEDIALDPLVEDSVSRVKLRPWQTCPYSWMAAVNCV